MFIFKCDIILLHSWHLNLFKSFIYFIIYFLICDIFCVPWRLTNIVEAAFAFTDVKLLQDLSYIGIACNANVVRLYYVWN